jgi:hypothetical protein
MDNNGAPALRRETPLTPVADKQGHEILICDPEWFDEKKTYRIANAPERTAPLEFTGSDLNFVARVLYAEASGSGQLTDKGERNKEKSAIMNVNHFRLNRKGYPNNSYVAKTFREVCEAPGQFESVFAATPKFSKSESASAMHLKKGECADLCEAIDAIKAFMAAGPTEEYLFDNFRGYNPSGQGTHVGRSRFWLSAAGQLLLKKTP